VSWQILQTRRFARVYKKLKPNVVVDVDAAVAEICVSPELGELKKGDLATLRVYKFHSAGQLYLLGYTVEEVPRLIYLEAIGPHENFYRDLKR
jgi:mRNA-degrading endonuclease RelE of RelBE toxin-antitoxin system